MMLMYRLNKVKKYFLIGICCSLSYAASGQDNSPDFSPQELKEIERQIVGTVSNFCDYLGDLAGSDTQQEYKPQLKKNLQSLFVTYATIEVVSKRHPNKPKAYPIKTYLDLVSTYATKFKFIALRFNKVVVDTKHLRDTVIDGKQGYVGSYSYWQLFIASNQDKESNEYTQADFSKSGSDKTPKFGTYYLISKSTTTKRKSNGGKLWYVLLGDIRVKANEYEPIK